jgi:hypothetical protein
MPCCAMQQAACLRSRGAGGLSRLGFNSFEYNLQSHHAVQHTLMLPVCMVDSDSGAQLCYRLPEWGVAQSSDKANVDVLL